MYSQYLQYFYVSYEYRYNVKVGRKDEISPKQNIHLTNTSLLKFWLSYLECKSHFLQN